jgi:hypothetical protein
MPVVVATGGRDACAQALGENMILVPLPPASLHQQQGAVLQAAVAAQQAQVGRTRTNGDRPGFALLCTHASVPALSRALGGGAITPRALGT